MAKASKAKVTTKRRRAHNVDGSFKADDPATPEVNEAYIYVPSDVEPLEVEVTRREGQRAAGGRYLGGKLIG